MSERRDRAAVDGQTGRRRRLLLLAVLAGLLAAASSAVLGPGEDGGTLLRPSSGTVAVNQGDTTVFAAPTEELRRLSSRQLTRRLQPLGRRRVTRGRVKIVLESDVDALGARVRRAVRAGGGTVPLSRRPVSASVRLPVVRQALRNNCESAALSMLLAGRGVNARQLDLQRALPRSGPLDPVLDAAGDPVLWGDPRDGYVGRAEGGGTAGGYGAYERPVRELARRRGVTLSDLSRSSPERVYRRLLAGRPVMVWIGLSDGPYKTWRTPRGERVTGNFGEHTVVLTGLEGGMVELNDPLVGRRVRWTRDRFERLWERLGRRAVSA